MSQLYKTCCAGTKTECIKWRSSFVLAQYLNQFLVWQKTFGSVGPGISSKYFGQDRRFFSINFFKSLIFKRVESRDLDRMSSNELWSKLHSANQLLTNNLSSNHYGSNPIELKSQWLKRFELKSLWLKTKWTQITMAQTIWAQITLAQTIWAQNKFNSNHH